MGRESERNYSEKVKSPNRLTQGKNGEWKKKTNENRNVAFLVRDFGVCL